MEFQKQASNMNTHASYITAPTSPNELSRNNSMEFYYSAPASPLRKMGPNLDDFEFETSKRFISQPGFGPPNDEDFDDRGPEARQKYRERDDSLPTMAFADELFVNGLVMPLKLPPRLQVEGDSSNYSFSLNKSPVFSSSPKSPRTVCRLPFSRKHSWNDNFDPFMVALQRVREEKRGRNSHYRRSRSLSPFRAVSKCNQDVSKEDGSIDPIHRVPPPSHSGPLDFKGSAYARWVRDQSREGLNPKSQRWLVFGQRVRPLRIEHDGSDKHSSVKERKVEESKVKKLKGFLLRYASFGSKQIKTTSDVQKQSYLSRMSFRFKGNGQSKGKKMHSADTNMAVVEYEPSLALSLGYGVAGLSK